MVAGPLPVTIRDLRPDDWPAVRAIYEDGIRSGDATFEREPPSWERWDGAHPALRLVAERDGALGGWAALSPVSDRCWTLNAGVFPENEASLRLHEACGFREVGVRERLGRLGGGWRDVVLLERRSRLVGT